MPERHIPAHVARVRRSHTLRCRFVGDQFVRPGPLFYRRAERLLQLRRELPFFRTELIAAGLLHRPRQDVRQHVVGQQARVVGALLEFHARFGRERAGLRALHDALPHRVQRVDVGMAGNQIDFGERGHDVGRGAAVGDDVMHAGLLRHVLAEHLDRAEHDHHAIERRSPSLRAGRRVRRHAVKAEQSAVVGEVGTQVHAIRVAWMPGQHGIGVGEQPCVNHVDLSAAALFRRCAVVANRAFEAARLHFFLDRHRRQSRRAAEEVVTARMTRCALFHRGRRRNVLLREPRQRIELAHDPDDGLAASPLGRERGRGSREMVFHREAIGAEFLLKQSGALVLVIPELGVLPDLP